MNVVLIKRIVDENERKTKTSKLMIRKRLNQINK